MSKGAPAPSVAVSFNSARQNRAGSLPEKPQTESRHNCSDYPVGEYDAMMSVWGMVTRQTQAGAIQPVR
jgi:hypothetical protein